MHLTENKLILTLTEGSFTKGLTLISCEDREASLNISQKQLEEAREKGA
jgi:hypothetical protein